MYKKKFGVLTLILSIFLMLQLQAAPEETPRKALSQAIYAGNLSKVKSLIESSAVGIDESSSEYDVSSPLVEAAKWAKPAILKYLVEKGAYIEGISETKSTPLTKIIETGGVKLSFQELIETVRFLIEAGADVNYPGTQGYTPLMNACKYTRSIELVETLLDLGAFIEARAEDENTPILLSLRHNNLKAFRLLMERGANLQMTCKGQTPLGILAFEGNILMAKYLVDEAKVDVNEHDAVGATALCWAASQGQGSMIKFLVEKGADINIKTLTRIDVRLPQKQFAIGSNYVTFPAGSTPLTFAKKFGGTPTVNLIYDLDGKEFGEIEPKEWTSWY